MNKASGGDGIPVELFQILKDDAVKVLHSIYQKIWKTQQSPQWPEATGRKLPDVQFGFRKGRKTSNQIANICWIIKKKTREFQKNIYFCFTDYAKAFVCVDHNKLWKIQGMGIPDHLTCLLRNPYAVQETTVRTGHGKTDWFQIRKGVCQGCILLPCLFNLYAEYIV